MNIKNKYKKLALSLLFDAMGLASYAIPGVGEFFDVIWAPAAAYLMTKMYKGNKGKIAAAITFIEEAMPGLDIVPTFTLMWLYTHVFTSSKEPKTTIEV
ncbi:hypothetical protein CXF68_15430 [Tenacibaculum sp. Bg11-29]|uniref:hypothetical protein n=1 Tax=Tenacibaculum sp. Bg11-29 TaxID=2058306 RepID=UPI000C33ABBE|nr:hypothetical protein [Tenacibaculum sp. Bg11-29]PKH51995.1 hypothetical protein CXF68_15430 [Tenacibaculum sp. Bg11-29]